MKPYWRLIRHEYASQYFFICSLLSILISMQSFDQWLKRLNQLISCVNAVRLVSSPTGKANTFLFKIMNISQASVDSTLFLHLQNVHCNACFILRQTKKSQTRMLIVLNTLMTLLLHLLFFLYASAIYCLSASKRRLHLTHLCAI